MCISDAGGHLSGEGGVESNGAIARRFDSADKPFDRSPRSEALAFCFVLGNAKMKNKPRGALVIRFIYLS
ncbi:MAG: hypothetical protein E6767_04755 [Dysgonomonas sp.]|nr:hypothetical protein [Dysgonomonas sp.]